MLPISGLPDEGKGSRPQNRRTPAAAPEKGDPLGNFSDFESLFEQLAQPNVMQLGKPPPKRKYLPGKRVGSCPAAHNRALLGEEPD